MSAAVDKAMAEFNDALTKRRVAEAVAAERKRCARVADEYGDKAKIHNDRCIAYEIAAAIRKGSR